MTRPMPSVSISTEKGFVEYSGPLHMVWHDEFLSAAIDKKTGQKSFQVHAGDHLQRQLALLPDRELSRRPNGPAVGARGPDQQGSGKLLHRRMHLHRARRLPRRRGIAASAGGGICAGQAGHLDLQGRSRNQAPPMPADFRTRKSRACSPKSTTITRRSARSRSGGSTAAHPRRSVSAAVARLIQPRSSISESAACPWPPTAEQPEQGGNLGHRR